MAKLIARNGRGYSFDAIRAKVLYGNGLKMSARPKYLKSKVWDFGLNSMIWERDRIEPAQYDTLGNEISTLTEEWDNDSNVPYSTSRFE